MLSARSGDDAIPVDHNRVGNAGHARLREDDQMKKVNWPVVVPIVLIGVLLGGLAVWRFSRASSPLLLWMSGGMPVLVWP